MRSGAKCVRDFPLNRVEASGRRIWGMHHPNWALIAVVLLTVFIGTALVSVAIFSHDPPTAVQKQLFDALLVLFAGGATAVFGLISTRKDL
jgi:hypothetical protein